MCIKESCVYLTCRSKGFEKWISNLVFCRPKTCFVGVGQRRSGIYRFFITSLSSRAILWHCSSPKQLPVKVVGVSQVESQHTGTNARGSWGEIAAFKCNAINCKRLDVYTFRLRTINRSPRLTTVAFKNPGTVRKWDTLCGGLSSLTVWAQCWANKATAYTLLEVRLFGGYCNPHSRTRALRAGRTS